MKLLFCLLTFVCLLLFVCLHLFLLYFYLFCFVLVLFVGLLLFDYKSQIFVKLQHRIWIAICQEPNTKQAMGIELHTKFCSGSLTLCPQFRRDNWSFDVLIYFLVYLVWFTDALGLVVVMCHIENSAQSMRWILSNLWHIINLSDLHLIRDFFDNFCLHMTRI